MSKHIFFLFQSGEGTIPRVKPLKYTYEKEIVMYAYFKRLVYFSTECVFAPNAYRGHARTFLKDLEKIRPSVIMDIIHSGRPLLLIYLSFFSFSFIFVIFNKDLTIIL